MTGVVVAVLVMGVVVVAYVSIPSFTVGAVTSGDALAVLLASLGASVEWVPVVQPGMSRNSSKVSTYILHKSSVSLVGSALGSSLSHTLGLQHVQPLGYISFSRMAKNLSFCSPFWPSWKTGGPGWWIQGSEGSVNSLSHPLFAHFGMTETAVFSVEPFCKTLQVCGLLYVM